jgi:adenine/guanine phosphoribosyltransferase-like PRPP-binding protein
MLEPASDQAPIQAPQTEATTGYWQRIVGADDAVVSAPPWRLGYPARLPDGRVLMLPIRALASRPDFAVASLLVNHASFEVADALAAMLAERLAPLAPDVIVGLPTLGLTLAAGVARRLGHARYVPLGTSRKFWYDEALSAAVESITTPGVQKRLYLDPHLLPLVRGRRVVIVDDAISTGSTASAPWSLLQSLGAQVLAYGVAMLQGQRWRHAIGEERSAQVLGVFECPLLQAAGDGWVPRA